MYIYIFNHTSVPTFFMGIGYWVWYPHDTQYPYPNTHFFWVLYPIPIPKYPFFFGYYTQYPYPDTQFFWVLYPIPIPKYPIFLVIIPNTHTQIPNFFGYYTQYSLFKLLIFIINLIKIKKKILFLQNETNFIYQYNYKNKYNYI